MTTDRDIDRTLEDLVSSIPAATRGLSAYRVPAVPPPIKLDANESPWPISESARDRLAAELRTVPLHRYPDGRATRVREPLAARFGGAPDDYVLGAGSDEVIALLMNAFSVPREGADHARVLYPTPTFVMYGITSRANGLEPVEVPLTNSWELDADAMDEALRTHRPTLAFYASPNNPTGNRFDDAILERLIASHPETLHIVDEAYGPFAARSRYDLCERYPQAGVLGTLSKVGLAAARVGWVRLHPVLAAELEKVRQPFNLNELSQVAAALALGELRDEFDAHVASIREERARVIEALAASPHLELFPTEANFVFARVLGPKSGDSQHLAEALLARDVAIRSFHKYGGRLAGHVRITVGTPAENDALLTALSAL